MRPEGSFLIEYADMIDAGEVVVGYWIKSEVQNLLSDLDDERFVYDMSDAHRRIRFQETLCLQSKEPYYMKPIRLMPVSTAKWKGAGRPVCCAASLKATAAS